ncbi:MAG: DUF1028 domain-containing protein [Actinomycetales bacterium]|nr:DUF1028 domain-containing protein [Actinomycetales bacterium]
MTFSVVLCDPNAAEGPRLGVAVASKFLAAGAVVPSARAGVGAVATQAMANLRYPGQVLGLLASGMTVEDAVRTVTGADDQAMHRQLTVVDAAGRSAAYTGAECLDWAGHACGPGFAVAGNVLTGANVIEEMTRIAQSVVAESEVSLARRLLAVLAAGDAVGGDRRGRQSAGLLVVGAGAGYGGGSDVAVDLRVDDHGDPVRELHRLLGIHELLFGRPEQLLPLEGDVALRLQQALVTLGYLPEGIEILQSSDSALLERAALERALLEAAGMENLEERLVSGSIDPVVLAYLEDLANDQLRA